jgi:hypothetical protein
LISDWPTLAGCRGHLTPLANQIIDQNEVYLPIGWVSHVEKEVKRSKRSRKLRDLLVDLENRYPTGSVSKVRKSCKVLFFFFFN